MTTLLGPRSLDLRNRKSGKLTAIRPLGSRDKHTLWFCRCVCGGSKEVPSHHITQRRVRSCGCANGILRRAEHTPAPIRGARWIPLGHGRFALVDTQDYKRVAPFRWCASKGRTTFYARSSVRGCQIRLHTFITGQKSIDHWDGNGLNNRRKNLRQATAFQNRANSAKHRDNTSGFKGVRQMRARWAARIHVHGRAIHLGTYDTASAAAHAYDRAAARYFGQYARLNPRVQDGR